MASNKGKNKSKKVTKEIEVKSNDIDKVKEADNEIKKEEKVETKQNSTVNEVKVRKVKKKNPNNKQELNQEVKQNNEEKIEKKDDSEVLKEIMKSADEADRKSKNVKVKQQSKSIEKEEKKVDSKDTENKKKTEMIKKDTIKILEQEIKEKNNKKKFTLLNLVLLVTFLFVFSTVFALMNQSSSKIVKGVKIRDIDVSNLTKEAATIKITEALELEFMREADLYYTEDYKTSIKPVQIEAAYKIEDAVDNAYKYGRDKNIIVDNYNILYAFFAGKVVDMEFTYNEESLNSLVNDIASKVPGKVIDYNYSIEEDELIVSKGTKGVEVNSEKLKKDIVDEITSRKIVDLINNEENVVITIEANEVEPAPIDINELYKEIYKEPVDAYYELEPFKLYPEEDGIDFAVSIEDAQKIVSDTTKEEYIIPLKISKASKTVNDIGKEAFPYEISTYSTKYDVTNTNRTQNLQLSAEKINGTVLMPGEEFSYNQVVGKRTVEAGYKNAKIYSGGQVVDGLGGGICQISSTLYNAVLMADLEVTERRNHYFKTSYVPAGRDATVVWGSIDFKFKNTRTYPIKIEAKVSSGIAEFKIHGIKEEKEYDIKILPVVTQNIPYSTQEIVDPTLMPGTRRIVQSGTSGCKVTTYIEKSLDGIAVSKEAISSDSYNPLTQIVHVAP